MAFQVGELNAVLRLEDRAFVTGLAASERKFREFGLGITKAAIAFGTTAAVAIGSGISAVIQEAGRFEQTQIALETLTGSAENARKLLKEMETFAIRTPFEMSDLENAVRLLRAYGFEVDELIPMLTVLGDATSALGLGADGLERLVLAIGQMRAKGIVQAEEMRQLANVGIPAWEILAETLGVDIPEAMEMVRDREVEAATAIPAILEGMNARFGGMMERQSQTLLGIWSNIRDVISLLMRDIGIAIIEGFDLHDRARNLMQWLQDFRQLVNDAGLEAAFRSLIPDWLEDELQNIADIGGQVLDFFRDLKSETTLTEDQKLFFLRWGEFLGLITSLIGAGAVLSLFFSRVNLVIGALSGLAAGFTIAYENNDEFRRRVDAVVAWFQDVAWPWFQNEAANIVITAFDTIVSWVEDNWPTIQTVAQEVWDALQGFWDWVVNTFSPTFIESGEEINRVWNEELGPELERFWDETIRPAWQGFLDWWEENGYKLLDPVVEFITWLLTDFLPQMLEVIAIIIRGWNDFKDEFGPLWDWAVDVFTTAWDQMGTIFQFVVDLIQGGWGIIYSIFTGDWEGLWDTVYTIFYDTWTAIGGFLENSINGIIHLINALIHGLNALPGPDLPLLEQVDFAALGWAPREGFGGPGGSGGGASWGGEAGVGGTGSGGGAKYQYVVQVYNPTTNNLQKDVQMGMAMHGVRQQWEGNIL